MADITMCTDKRCDKRHTCYRFKAKASKHRQSYFNKSPRKGDKCDYYWEVQNE